MSIGTQFSNVRLVFLDTAPIIYFVEKHLRYFDVVRSIFEEIDAHNLETVTSPITLAECLVHPYRVGHMDAVYYFTNLLVNQTNFVEIDQNVALRSAEIRAYYNLSLPDAIQFAVALYAGCDAFLTNDIALKRVTELKVIVLNEFL
ncbi:MAG: type II toxin-antitoxin system VapC family toxin [Anaerolineae bacterium]|nr:type II toxin-antitoxin system VapC family toxin [Anaerolineae bacterium]